MMVPAVTLHALVPGIRAQVADARDRLIEYLVANFGEIGLRLRRRLRPRRSGASR